MLFNSFNFLLFLPIVYTLYWAMQKNKLIFQNSLLLVASYFFYACWNYKFLFLLIFSTFLDYFTGIKMFESHSNKNKRIWFWISIIVNLGFLAVFKYYNFFIESFSQVFNNIGLQSHFQTLQVILPVGISFYTFHGLSYVIDIYYNRIKPEKNFIDYSLFVSFFPLLVAGPIERATHLLPQIISKRKFEYSKSVDGLRQILWGLFKKVVIADNCAEYANIIFVNYLDYPSSTLLFGAIMFSFQIYCDFSGYSDIALGTARLFGIELLRNFAFPYFSRDIAEFWRRWHISLSSWFKDYLYIPLGGSKGSMWIKVRNTFIIFIVSGFWHGANWTFIAWGFLNALFIIPSIIFKTNRNNLEIVAQGKYLPTLKDFFAIVLTFSLASFAWIFFRASSITNALSYISKIFSYQLFTMPYVIENGTDLHIFPKVFMIIICIFITIEWLGRGQHYAIQGLGKQSKLLSWTIYYSIIGMIFYFAGREQQFIYFQF